MTIKESLQQTKALLDAPQIRSAALGVLEDPSSLEPLLARICRDGFARIPVPDHFDTELSRRLLLMQREFEAQLPQYRRDSRQWSSTALLHSPAPEQLVCAVGALAAGLYAQDSRQQRLLALLGIRAARRSETGAEDRVLMDELLAVSLCQLFQAGYWPAALADPAVVSAVSAVTAMASYVTIKRGYLPGIHPEISLDTVCILSFGLSGILSGLSEYTAEEIANVSAVMSAACMHVREWPVLCGCMMDLPRLSLRVIAELLAPAVRLVLGDAPGAGVRWKRIASQPKDLRRFCTLLEYQAALPAAAPAKDEAPEAARHTEIKLTENG